MATTLAEINERNRDFWQHQSALVEVRMKDEAIRKAALETLGAEATRQLPVYFRTTLEQALRDAETAKHRFLHQQAQKGGRAKKSDALQELIDGFVQRNPAITELQLQARLQEHIGIKPIEDIADGVIYFTNRDGRTKEAALSGLKDRLSRSKKKLGSR